MREQLQVALGSAYMIERELGGGGMSRVFLAEESALGRRVVVKVLAPELTEGLSAERFAREVRLAARLQHPNIVPLLSAGERNGLAYYTMPYVEGESLHARLAREGRLKPDAAVSVLRDMARALEYAHVHGVVHRDVKPQNILLAGSAATVADFGIAKALRAARTAGRAEAAGSSPLSCEAPPETLTRAGISLGTPAYMAPEQAAGDPDVDARADIYSWGVVAYELLAGAPPFAGRSSHQLVVAHIGELPLPVTERASGVPPALAALVMRCLEKDPAARPQSASEVLTELEVARTPVHGVGVHFFSGRGRTPSRRWLPTAGAALVAATLAAAGVVAYRARHGAAPVTPVLAVLPFENLGAPSEAYFADGLTEEIRARLSGVAGLQVIGGRSAAQYKGSKKAMRDIGRELGATHLLTGTIRWERAAGSGGHVRVNPELVRVTDQANVWTEPVEAPLTNVFEVQARVAERVAVALDVVLRARGQAARSPPTSNPAAYDAYLRGLAFAAQWDADASVSRAAVAAFARAVALDPHFAAAHARLAIAQAQAGMFEEARDHAARALALDSASADAHFAQAEVLLASGDPERALREFETAERAAPGSAEVVSELGMALMYLERDESAREAYERAMRLEPRSPQPPGMLAGQYEAVSRYEEAVATREREIALAPQAITPYVWQAAAHLLWRADTATARQTLGRADPASLSNQLVSYPTPLGAGRAIWIGLMPAAVLAARDTITLADFVRQADWGTPELYHLMKARHFWLTGRASRARVHADSIIALLAPTLQRSKGTTSVIGWFSQRTTLAEAYAYAGRSADAARLLDAYVTDVRGGWERTFVLRTPFALVEAAYIDAVIGRRDIAVARLDEALRTPPGGRWISRALLRADPWWAPLRGHPGFERLISGTSN